MKRLPVDTSSFYNIRREGDLYVDKTPWIHRMLTEGRCYFLSRPRRFGKSLTVNTLMHLFRGEKELFRGLYIYDKWEFEPYPVILFDFNGISHDTPDNFKLGLYEKLEEFAERYEVSLKGETLNRKFESLISELFEKTKKGIVFLIDEYDKPIIDHLGLGEERFQIALQNRDIMKSFFGVLKEGNVVDRLRFVFVTGISAFTKVSIFSEWNNLIDISTSPKYADFLGYTEEEVLAYFKEHLEAFCKEKGFNSIEECMKEIRYWYNGYRFSPDRDIQVYNPISLMMALSEKRFDNFWFETGTPSFLVNLLKTRDYIIPDLEHLWVERGILKAFDLDYLPVEVILFQAGYLTIKGVEEELIRLGYPNWEVKRGFAGYLLRNLYQAALGVSGLAKALGKALYRENWEEVKERLNQILAQIPYPLYGGKTQEKAGERFFHTVFYLSLCLIGYDAEAETLSPGGRGDMAVKIKDKVFVMEFKAGAGADAALRQIEEKGYARRYEGKGLKIFKLGISFDPEKREVREIKVK